MHMQCILLLTVLVVAANWLRIGIAVLYTTTKMSRDYYLERRCSSSAVVQ